LQKYFNLEGYIGAFGIDSRLNEKSVLKLVQEGSGKEDSPACRAANHFHNPIAPGAWDEGKLTDPHLLISIVACNTFFPEFPFENVTSNLTWATGFTSINPVGKDSAVMERNEWDWASAREYYFTAATGLLYNDYYDTVIAVDEEQRNILLENTLIAVGYVAHLLQDTSVPAHVRNDFSQGHTMINYEAFNLPWKWIGNSYEKYLARNDENITAFKSFPIRSKQVNSRLTDFWDTNQFNEGFDGNNASMDSFGLAEYTSLNFLSEFTIFTPEFPFPNIDDVIIIKEKPYPWSIFNRKYYSTTTNHPGEIIGHLAVASNLNHYIEKYTLPGMILKNFPIYMDTKCYDEYAAHLIPRAVGFSADLIDYFFRGRIEISPIHPQHLVVRGNGSGDISVFKITVRLRNATSDSDSQVNTLFANENMEEGSLYAVAKYEMDGVVKYSLSKRIYIRSSSNNLMSDTTLSEYNFDFSKEPIPLSASNIAIQVVFRGTLGNEKDIAVAVGRIPLFDGTMEITPPSEYVYSIIDASTFYIAGIAQPQFFTTLKASLKNLSAAKEIKEGTLTAIASYRRLKNYKPDMAGMTPLLSSEREDTVSSSISEPISIDSTNSVTSNGTREFTFDFRHAPLPAGITDLYLYIVFEGTLHDPAANTDQSDALVVGIKDLNEPQHLTYWNDTDYFLLNGYPRTAQWIRENDPHFVNFPDYPGYGYIDPHNVADSVSFLAAQASGSMPELIRFDLEPGRYSRIIVLTEAPEKYYVTDTLTAPENPYVPAEGFVYEYEFARTINQLNSDGLWHTSPYLSARGAYQHDRTYYINFWPYFIFKDSVPVPANDLVPVRATNVQFP
jgi:hypothetical protein